jgi:hypothetical protein
VNELRKEFGISAERALERKQIFKFVLTGMKKPV